MKTAAVLIAAFQLGAWIVIASKSLINRKREMQMKKEFGPTDYSNR